jgi:hypothetical protein
MKKTLCFCLLVFMLVFGFIGCDNGSTDAEKPKISVVDDIVTIPTELHGTWKDQYDWHWIFTGNSYKGYDDGGSFTVVVSSNTPENNDSYQIGIYPSGYKLKGKFSSSTGRFVSSADHAIGKDFIVSFYINDTKNIIIMKDDNISFIKQ